MGDEMSRLLHAAARRARIEAEWKGVWSGVAGIHFVPEFNYRIRPDDAHLAYGPISTALREVALTGDCDDADIPYIRITMLKEDGYSDSTEDQRCVFLLILAEALADKGL
jgi:hypothetical protein